MSAIIRRQALSLIPATGVAGTAAAQKPRRLTNKYRRELRERAEEVIQYLIDLVDQLDGDADFEPELSQDTGFDNWNDQAIHWMLPAQEGDDTADMEMPEWRVGLCGLGAVQDAGRRTFRQIYSS